ncbi:MAG: DUF1295 domain-containing protein [Tenericutes bacterium]|jgi:steroid 5-alpha reductase family enzyme|nr:DUF1295 domain-containing protein [Mycoplasmatota bacterium]
MNYLKMSKNQTGIFFIVAYLIAIAIGVLVFFSLKPLLSDVILLTFVANLFATVVIFGFSLITKNASMYDPYWSVIPPVIIVGWILYYSVQINAVIWLLLVGIILWAIRLTYNWWKNWPGFKEQDWRYDLIQERTRGYYLLSNFGAIHLIPTLVVYIQLINAHDVVFLSESLSVLSIVGFALMIFASTIQFIADKQMFDFRQNRVDKNECINQGVWRYSRHPNYLGELSLWVGVYLMYLGVVGSIDFNIIYPIAMISLFMFVSIPMMEMKLANRECFKEYKKQVSMLFPYRKRKRN